MSFGLARASSARSFVPRGFAPLAWFWLPIGGFFRRRLRLFTMYLPPLFPTLMRTTGAGFCYNIGRIAAALASIVFGLLAPVGNFASRCSGSASSPRRRPLLVLAPRAHARNEAT